jgi:hypothetical protein
VQVQGGQGSPFRYGEARSTCKLSMLSAPLVRQILDHVESGRKAVSGREDFDF